MNQHAFDASFCLHIVAVFVVTEARVKHPPQTIKSSETKIYAEVKTQKWIKEKKEAEVRKRY